MFITSRIKCSKCSGPFIEGDKLRCTTTGHVEKIGGLGLYKDQLTLRTKIEVYEHDPICPPIQVRKQR
jgi:hypothetical protein